MKHDLCTLDDLIYHIAPEILKTINAQPEFQHQNPDERQVLCLIEELGEFVQAYRRNKGMARKTGPWSAVCEELADVVITACVTACALKINLSEAISDKLEVISERGGY